MKWGDYGLGAAYVGLQGECRAFVEACSPWLADIEDDDEFPPRLLDAFRQSGLASLVVPAAHGGRTPTVDPLAFVVVREALSQHSAHLDMLFSSQALGSFPISLAGSEVVQRRFLPSIATGEILPALALTEPEAGSDLRSLTTTIHPDGDELVVSGTKAFISNAGVAGFYTVLAKEAEGHSFVVIPADTPGLRVVPGPPLIAAHVLGEVHMDECRVPTENRVGKPGEGWPLLLSTLSVFRAGTAAAAVGLSDCAVDIAMRHCGRREQFGRPLARIGPVAQLLADAVTEVEMARLITYRAGEKAREDPMGSLGYSSMAKLAATEAACRVADRCIQVMGRFGLVRENRVERIYRSLRPMRIYEGASEILRLAVAKEAGTRVDPIG